MRGLPDRTRELFERICWAPGIDRFLLVGGTALALRHAHRLSEDLDFMTTGRIDSEVVADILNHLHVSGAKHFKKTENIGDRLRLAADGADVDDYSQTWRVDGAKLQFFSKRLRTPQAQQALASRLTDAPVGDIDTGLVRVATESCIFSLKAQLIEERLTSRDLYDLRTLLQTGRYSIGQLLDEAAALGANPDFVKERIVLGVLHANDPPVNSILGQSVDIGPTRAWLTERINEYERELAARVGQGPVPPR